MTFGQQVGRTLEQTRAEIALALQGQMKAFRQQLTQSSASEPNGV